MLTALRKRILTVVASLLMIASPLAVPVVAFAQPPAGGTGSTGANIEGNLACGTTQLTVDGGDCKTSLTGGTSRINNIITDAINIFSIIVGIIAVIMIIVGGFKYITSGGDSGNITKIGRAHV